MNNLFFLFCLIFAQDSYSMAVKRIIPPISPTLEPQLFMRYTCQGITTEVGVTPVYKDLLKVYFLIDPNKPYPTVRELLEKNPARFDYITSECNDRRYRLTSFAAGVATWSNDRKHQKILIDEVSYSTNKCRTPESGCTESSQCCSGKCELDSNSCSKP